MAAEQNRNSAEQSAAPWLVRWRSTMLPLALILIVVLAAYFRSLSITNWDSGTGQHPDERFFTNVASTVRLPAGPAQYFDSARSPLNPRNYDSFPLFVYGPFPITLTRFVAVSLTPDSALSETVALANSPPIANPERALPKFEWLQSLLNPTGRDLTGYYEIVKVGRWLALLFDLASIVLVYLIAARLFDRRAGLLAALLAALAVMQIQQSHFFVDPIFSTFFGLLALYWAIRAAQTGSWYSYALTGVSIGVAAANRVTLVTIALVAIVAAVLDALRRARQEQRAFADLFLLRSFPLLCLAGLLTIVTFRTLQPDAFIGSQPDSPPIAGQHASALDVMQGWGFFDLRLDPRYLDNLSTVRSLVTGEFDYPPSQQWVGRPAYLFPWQNMVLWGMGPLLGLTAWAGWLAFALWRLRALRHALALAPPARQPHLPPPHAAWLLWIWVAFYFGWQGAQFAITMRYMLPIYGALICFAAWALVALWDWSYEQRSDPVWLRVAARRAVRWLPLLVVLATFAWAYAFSRIYTEPHSRVMAARWLVNHAPPGSTIAAEIWDDPLPLQVDGQALWGTVYQGIDTAPYAEDDPEKYYGRFNAQNEYEEGLLDQLERADYITLTSNRIYDSTSRLPYRYPALMRYYHYLFNGELGFDLVAEITSYPRLLGFEIPDYAAEEAFSVYDHPRVLIFEKTADFSRARAEELLTGDVNWGEVYKLPVRVADRSDDALRFTSSEWPAYRAAGTWSQLFTSSGLAATLAPLRWLLVLELLAAAGFVLLFHLLPRMPDRGFSMAKTLAILLTAYAAWLLSALGDGRFPFAPLLLWACAVPLLLAAAYIGWRSRAELVAFWHERRGALLSAQAVFLAFFALGLLLRWFNPDLWHPARGGEKPMDFAFLNAVLKSASFPPYDPWHAGGYINYYYFGFVLVGALVHLSGVVPAVAYNLAVASIFALTALGCWSVVYNLLAPRRILAGRQAEGRARIAALLAPLLVLLLGNLVQALWFLNGYAAEQAANGRAEWAFWDATRIVPGTVNEFPFFTFLFADLHAHMMVMPLSLALLGLSVAAVRHAPRGLALLLRRHWPILLLMGLLAGALRATNTWDYPSFVGLALLSLALPTWQDFRRRQRRAAALPALVPLLHLGLAAALLLLAGNLLFLPFTADFVTESSGLELFSGERTSVADVLRLYGFWIFVMVSAGLALTWRLSRGNTALTALLGAALLLTAIAGVQFSLPALALLVPLLVAWLVLFWRARDWPPCAQLPLLWAGAALGLLLLVELVVVRGDVGRMNTVFKFGLHSWILFGLASAVALPWLWRAGRHALAAGSAAGRLLVYGWRAATLLLLAAALVYPLTATPARIADRFAPDLPRGLDGAAFMRYVESGENGRTFSLAEDAAAIQWLHRNVDGTPVIVEAHLPSYRWAGRVATYTGLPTILGWEWHQIQQRMAVEAEPVIRHRQQVVSQIYNTPDADQALRLLNEYGVEYLYVGGVERALYDPVGLAKFEHMAADQLSLVFSSGDTRIYQVLSPGQPTMLTTDLAIEPPSQRTPPPLMLDEPVQELPTTGANVWQNPLGSTSLAALLLWLPAIYAIAMLGLPAALLVFGRARDAGVIWARPIGLLLLGYLIWLPTSLGLWHYDAGGIVGGWLLALALNLLLLALLGRREAPANIGPVALIARGVRGLLARLRECRREWLIGEVVFLSGFGLFTLIRAFNPDLWHPVWGGEKPMGFGFLNAILRSPVMPPYDPFFSDGHINYYYYGLYLVSLPIRMLSIDPAIAFNLAVATLAGLSLAGAYWIVTRLSGKRRYGLLGALFLGLIGNLAGVFAAGWSAGIGPVLRALGAGSLAGFGERLGDWYIGPSRVIPHTINEFPFFAFLFADLHPHLIALPLTLLAIALAYEFVVGPPGRLAMALRLAVAALTLGALAVTNSWDFPTYVLLSAAALSAGRAFLGPQMRRAGWQQRAGVLARGLLLGLLLAIGSMALYAPFFDAFYPMVSGIGMVTTFTSVGDYFLLYGLFLAVLLPVLAGALQRSLGGWRAAAVPLIILAVLLAGAAFLPALGLRIGLLVLLLLLAFVLLRARMGSSAWFLLLLTATAVGVSLGIETIYIRDHLDGGDWYRMNTVFKFGMQIWVLLALAAAAGLPLLLRGLRRLGGVPAGTIGLALIVTLIALAAVYPLAGTPSRIANRFDHAPAPTLDGLAFLDGATFEYDCEAFGGCQPGTDRLDIDLSGDGQAIAWLNQNTQGTPVVVQSPLWFYRAYGIRVAANSGLPTVVSALHVNEQRDPFLAGLREREVSELYRTSDREQALRLLLKYRVDYIYVGAIEHAFYPVAGLNKFAEMAGTYLEPVYDANNVQIYAVNGIPASYAEPRPAVFAEPAPAAPAEPELPLISEPPAEPPADLADLEAAVAADPENGPLVFSLAERYRSLQRYDDANRVLAVAASANPFDVGLHHLWGDILVETGRFAEAEQAYMAAVRADASAGNWTKVGVGLLAGGALDKAEIAFNQALALDAKEPEPYFRLGQIYVAQDNPAAARDMLERYLAMAPAGQYVFDARELLATIEQ